MTTVQYRVTWFPPEASRRQRHANTLDKAREIAAEVGWAPIIEKVTVTQEVEFVENWVDGDPREHANS